MRPDNQLIFAFFSPSPRSFDKIPQITTTMADQLPGDEPHVDLPVHLQWLEPDPNIRRDGIVHSLRTFAVRTSLIETAFVGNMCILIGATACFLTLWVLLVAWRFFFNMGDEQTLSIVPYMSLITKVYPVLFVVELEFYAMCRIVQWNQVGVPRRRHGWSMGLD